MIYPLSLFLFFNTEYPLSDTTTSTGIKIKHSTSCSTAINLQSGTEVMPSIYVCRCRTASPTCKVSFSHCTVPGHHNSCLSHMLMAHMLSIKDTNFLCSSQVFLHKFHIIVYASRKLSPREQYHRQESLGDCFWNHEVSSVCVRS